MNGKGKWIIERGYKEIKKDNDWVINWYTYKTYKYKKCAYKEYVKQRNNYYRVRLRGGYEC